MTDFDAQIAALERDISDKFSQYQTRKEERNTNKAKIKEWNTSFTAREGRAPSNEDKAQIRPLYIAHKRHETELKELKAELTRLKGELEKLRVAKAGAEAKAKADAEAEKAKALAEAEKAKQELEQAAEKKKEQEKAAEEKKKAEEKQAAAGPSASGPAEAKAAISHDQKAL